MKHITIACENTDAIQAMYVDGILVREEDNFYLSDIAEVAEGKIVTLRILEVDLPEDNEWPELLEDLIEMQKRLTDVDNDG
jgi:hypothetical protein